jgi:hypothetical protein
MTDVPPCSSLRNPHVPRPSKTIAEFELADYERLRIRNSYQAGAEPSVGAFGEIRHER